MTHPDLKLPSIEVRTDIRSGEEVIFDIIRKKFLVLTPEEWVRQHFIGLLINNLNYPKGLFQVERQHEYYRSKKRTDILVLDKQGKSLLLVECKAYDVEISQKTLEQIAVYNKTIQAKYIAVSNGIKHFVWISKDGNYLQLDHFPDYSD